VRAAVYAAFDVRDDPEAFAAACADVVRIHRLAPLIEYKQALELMRKASDGR
jgi:hypothetical protein